MENCLFKQSGRASSHYMLTVWKVYTTFEGIEPVLAHICLHVVTYWGRLPSNLRVPASGIDPKLITVTVMMNQRERETASYGNILFHLLLLSQTWSSSLDTGSRSVSAGPMVTCDASSQTLPVSTITNNFKTCNLSQRVSEAMRRWQWPVSI